MTIKIKETVGNTSVEIEGDVLDVLKYQLLYDIDEQILKASHENINNLLKFRRLIVEETI